MVLKNKIKSIFFPEKPEVKFNRQLCENPYFPFKTATENSTNLSAPRRPGFELALSSRNYYYGLFMAIVCLVAVIVWPIIKDPSEYKLIPLIVLVLSASMAWENRGRRKCVLDGNNSQYVYFVNDQVNHTGKIHNIYIRLKAQKHGAGEMYYYVVFNGFNINEQKITSYSKNDKKLRILAKRLAESLDLNYFDVKVNSKEHIIRHRPPEVVDSTSPV